MIGKQLSEVPAEAGVPVPDPAQSRTVTLTSDDVTQRAVGVSVSDLFPVQSADFVWPTNVPGVYGSGSVQVHPAEQSLVLTHSLIESSRQSVS